MKDYLTYTENNLLYLVDTGSPFSIRYGGSALGSTLTHMIPDILNQLTAQLDHPVDGLIGTDQLRTSRWHFDPTTEALVRIGDAFDLNNYVPVELGTHIGLPTINVTLNDEDYCLVIDTCSTLNYLKRSLLSGESTSVITDYHPMLGHFTTHGYPYTITAMTVTQETLVYELPSSFEMTLGNKVQGILSYRFIAQFEWILDLSRNVLWMKQPVR